MTSGAEIAEVAVASPSTEIVVVSEIVDATPRVADAVATVVEAAAAAQEVEQVVAGTVTLDAEEEAAAATEEVEEDAAAGALALDAEEEAPAASAAKRIAKPRRRESITGWNILSPNIYREAAESAVAQPRKRGRPRKRQIDILGRF